MFGRRTGLIAFLIVGVCSGIKYLMPPLESAMDDITQFLLSAVTVGAAGTALLSDNAVKSRNVDKR